jgi:adenylate cyclase
MALVVDDEPDMLDFLCRVLRRDYQVRRCKNAKEAASVLAHAHFSLVITDQTMPGETGIHFLERVGAEYPELVRVLLTGYAELPEVERAIAAGAIDAHALKPVDEETLLRAVTQATARRAEHQP